MIVIGLLLAAVVGISLGMLGGGGSILAVPIFVYVIGFDTKESIAMSLAVVGATSLVAAIGHWRGGRVNWRIADIFGAVAMGGTYLGARLAVFFSGSAQLIFFAAIMLLAAYFMYRERNPLLERSAHAAGGGKMPLTLIVVEGLIVGVATGLVGVGGGFLVVPALVLLGGIAMKEAVGTSLVVIAMKSASGLVGYLGQVEIPWGFVGRLFYRGGDSRQLRGLLRAQIRPPAYPGKSFRTVSGSDGGLDPVPEPGSFLLAGVT